MGLAVVEVYHRRKRAARTRLIRLHESADSTIRAIVKTARQPDVFCLRPLGTVKAKKQKNCNEQNNSA